MSLAVRNCAFYYETSGGNCTFRLASDPPPPAPRPGEPAAKADPKAPPVVVITGAEAAQIAISQLQLPAVAPGVGPDPSTNQWKMAAVGYSLWLWADGPTHVGPVSQSVGNLFVSLDAQLTSVTYEMGDGHTVTCSGPGVTWTSAVEPGATSSCGYRYTKPSLPKGDYTVRAVSHWDIAWQAGTETGVVQMDQVGTRELPVGELQVLVR